MDKNILHFLPNEKITNDIIENFTQLNNKNYFLLFSGMTRNLIHDGRCVDEISMIDFQEKLNFYNIQGIIIHGLFHEFIEYILKVPDSIKIAWFVWGFDIYNQEKVKRLLYAPLTKKEFFPLKHRLRSFLKQNKILSSIYFSFSNKNNTSFGIIEVYKKIDYFCTYIKEDFEFFNKHFENNTHFIDVPFCNIDQYLGGNKKLEISLNASNILIGNSNSRENNHIDVFYFIKNLNQDLTSELVVPLSYGKDDEYKKQVVKYGEKLFQNKFIPLLDFMDKKIYLETLRNCSCAIFLHYRQQAMGNIIALLYIGVRIYFSKNNPVLNYCKRVGLIVFEFESEYSKYKNTILKRNELEINRQILDKIFDNKRVLNKMKSLVEIL